MNPLSSSENSAQFVETFMPETIDIAQARRASSDLGLEPVSAATAQFLTMMTRLVDAHAVVEIGTGAGVSALALFSGLAEDGILTSVDREPEHQFAAREALKGAEIPHTRFRLITGDALAVLPRLRAEAYDLVFIDADVMEYPECLEEGLRIVRPGGAVILDHVLLSGRVADEDNNDDETIIMRDTLEAARAMDGLTTAIVPVGDGLLVCVTDPKKSA